MRNERKAPVTSIRPLLHLFDLTLCLAFGALKRFAHWRGFIAWSEREGSSQVSLQPMLFNITGYCTFSGQEDYYQVVGQLLEGGLMSQERWL